MKRCSPSQVWYVVAHLQVPMLGSDVLLDWHCYVCVCACVCVCSGPQPGWDPDIVAALEAAESSNTLEDELEDDFVAMVSETHTPV